MLCLQSLRRVVSLDPRRGSTYHGQDVKFLSGGERETDMKHLLRNITRKSSRVHDKVITWTEHHPVEAGEMITASADGLIKVWSHPN